MCGISCVLALHGASLEGKQAKGPEEYESSHDIETNLNKSLDLIAHRGPDSRGIWTSLDKRVALGHVRLAINDLSADGAQPFHDANETIHAVVNGELYDHERIREDLVKSTDYQFKGRSDCEIVVALYRLHGLSFLSHLRGEFALCLYDSKTQSFIAARDRYGIKPLFYTFVNGRLLIAAEAKAFLALGWKPEWDVKSLLDGGWNYDQRTLFQGVYKRRVDARTEVEMIAGVREHLLNAIRVRLRADVPVGIYLSGGIDSSVIAGMVTHLVNQQGEQMGSEGANKRVQCFSIAFDEESGYDESSIAERTAKFLDVNHTKKHMNEEELAKRFEDATWHCEHHNPDLNFVGKFALSEEPRAKGWKVVLTGEGSDEIFGGYPMYLPDFLREPDYAWPQTDLPDEVRSEACKAKDDEAAEFYRSIGADGDNRGDCVALRQLHGITTCASMAAFSFTMWASWTQCYGNHDPRLTIAHNANGRVRDAIRKLWHPLHSAQYIWTKGHLANQFLSCLGDRTEMAHSLEARTPFLDHHLTEYVDDLPPSVKIRYNPKDSSFVEKWILREASKPFITHELYERKKHAYSAPTTWPSDGPLHKVMAKLMTRENVEQLGFVDWEQVNTLVERAFEEKDAKAMRFTLIVAEWVVISKRFGVKRAEPPVPRSR
ncbi:MAG: hypothetical protein Q9159_005183 [Coniocarpon cinnabarinum]